MWSVVVFCVSFVLLHCSSAHPQSDNETPDQNWLVLSTEINRTSLSVGDHFEIKYSLTNFGDHPIRFHQDPHKFARLTSNRGEISRIAGGSQVMEGAMVTLSPRETYQEAMVGTVEEGIGYLPKGKLKSDGQEQVKGLFLAFPTHKLFLASGQGKYTFQPLYRTWQWEHRSNVHHIQIKQ